MVKSIKRKPRVKSTFEITKGSAKKLGATVESDGVNFAVYSPNATKVELCFFNDTTEKEIGRLTLPGKKGRVWHGFVKGIKVGQLYGYRVYGENNPHIGQLHDPDKLLLDPYTKALSKPMVWNERLYKGDSQSMMAKSVVIDSDFDWQGIEKPQVPDSDTVIYETHVKGFTQLHPDVPEEQRGTYLGLCHPKVIKYLKDLGITSLQLMPVAAFMSEPRLKALGLTNYWGYNPINFFSPEPRYAVSNAVEEFKTLVREMHKNGIEIILDVVFNHSAEADEAGPILSFKGFDNLNFYLFEQDGEHKNYVRYVNNTGCGNSINLDNPYVLQMVTASLRYWVEEMQVDGFRFDLAVSLAREGNEFDNYSAFFKVLFQDPVLSQVKLIAEPWDIGYGGYRLGQFPPNWHECNDKFRDTVKGFWIGDHGLLPDLATRLMGSRDVFVKGFRSINTSVNYIGYHDGFTLEDLVSYNEKHNFANCEENRDGHNHNLSFNNGIEGPTHDKAIRKSREKHKRNLLATLFLSQGTPHLLAGDEIGRSQLGNNNAYCQDNTISWLNWQIKSEHKSQLEFVQKLIKLRHSSALLHSLSLDDDTYYGNALSHHVFWFTELGQPMADSDWNQGDRQHIMILMTSTDKKTQAVDEAFLLILNASNYSKEYQLPVLSHVDKWQCEFDTHVDTYLSSQEKLVENRYKLHPKSMSLLSWRFKPEAS
ncbi:glycogen debranching protein GlgX [Catenovulum sp. SM1970]|uniref:glycogen debranching protein GlgX n=1 Tax=Marinifaba aquimaris TaxID=2741323 RepID=UPI001572374A|nr:glycogen debranching protein GlgX [Marinifaba aquimaris]NTS76978.1 glycogen debranching protein GlgX [Marinifaba aquimaris]